MRLFDIIKGIFNPKIIVTYYDIVNNHSDAFKRWKGKLPLGTFSCDKKLFSFHLNFSDKKYIANHKSDILAFEKIIAEEKAFDSRRQQVIDASEQYPLAFKFLLKKLSVPCCLKDNYETLPGERISNRSKRIAQEELKKKRIAQEKLKKEQISQAGLITEQFCVQRMKLNHLLQAKLSTYDMVRAFAKNQQILVHQPNQFSNFFNSPKKPKNERSVKELENDEYDMLYSHLKSLPREQENLKKKLKEEDYFFSFEDRVLDIPKRSLCYKDFLLHNGKKEDDYEYIIENIVALDIFAKNHIRSQYDEIKKRFPDIIQKEEIGYLINHQKIDDDYRLNIVKYADLIEEEDLLIKEYIELKKKYPKGLPAFEKFHYNVFNTPPKISINEIIQRKHELPIFEVYADAYASFVDWMFKQSQFAQLSSKLSLKDFSWHKYDVPIKGVNPDGSNRDDKYCVCQHFYHSYSNYHLGHELNDDYVLFSQNGEKNSDYLTGNENYTLEVYDAVWNLIIAHKKKVGDISIIFASNGLNTSESTAFNHSKLEYLFSKIIEANIPYCEIEGAEVQNVKLTKHILVFEFLTSNTRLKETIKLIRDRYLSIQPLISYISLRKGYDDEEIEEFIAKKENERQKQKAKEEADKRKFQQELKRKTEDLDRLRSCVSSWETMVCGLKCSYLLYYYPTTCSFEATNSEWNDRWVVWNFKNTPGKTSSDSHQSALNTVIPELKNKLLNTFGCRVNKLTLVCVPASSQKKTVARYEEFSRKLCLETGMENSYDKITVIESKAPKHLGGTSLQVGNIFFDSTFFEGKFIILFDDVITSGTSMNVMRKHLTKLGAYVIAGLSIGKTIHQRPL